MNGFYLFSVWSHDITELGYHIKGAGIVWSAGVLLVSKPSEAMFTSCQLALDPSELVELN